MTAAEHEWLDRTALFEHCSRRHPGVTVEGFDDLESVPHLKGTSLTIGMILERLYVHGSIESVVHYYADLTEEQLREAILYANSFIEKASGPLR